MVPARQVLAVADRGPCPCPCAPPRWEEDILVTRAPGRLDVMGGIADYSGALVLQMPIREACHVALQRQPLGKQRLWNHIKVWAWGAVQRASNHHAKWLVHWVE
jgi:hypothetical protein